MRRSSIEASTRLRTHWRLGSIFFYLAATRLLTHSYEICHVLNTGHQVFPEWAGDAREENRVETGQLM
jgi:hypothetical protein